MNELIKEAQLELQAEEVVTNIIEKLAININGKRYRTYQGKTQKGDVINRLTLSTKRPEEKVFIKTFPKRRIFSRGSRAAEKVVSKEFSKYTVAAVAILAGLGLTGGIYAATRN